MSIRLARYEISSIDDPLMDGLSLSLFISGCKRDCVDCQNPELMSFSYGEKVKLNYIRSLVRQRKKLISSVSYVGGDWMYFPLQYTNIATFAKKLKLTNILYTGFSILEISPDIITISDIIVDGSYEKELATPNTFPASSNQSVYIDGLKLAEDQIRDLPINQHLRGLQNA